MQILVTAGNTQTPIDKVRCLTNIFSGRTGARIAIEAARRGHFVTFMTSHPEVIADLAAPVPLPVDRWKLLIYRTFDELQDLMESNIPGASLDAIIHAAAVSDYSLAGVFARNERGEMVDVLAAKVKSHHSELWLRLVPTPKLIDRIRDPWGFKGVLVKFKLEVDIGDDELIEVAERARVQSRADLMVANSLEGMNSVALLGPLNGVYERIDRAQLAGRVLDAVESISGGPLQARSTFA